MPGSKGRSCKMYRRKSCVQVSVKLLRLWRTLQATSTNVVNIVGGGIKDKMILSIYRKRNKAVVSTGPVEATSIGNVIVQAMAMGAIKDINEGRKVVRNSFDIKTYEPQDSEKWDAAYEKWKEIIKTHN